MNNQNEKYLEDQMEATASTASSIYGELFEIAENMESHFVIDWDNPDIEDILDVPDDQLEHDIDNPSALLKQCDDAVQKLLYLRSVVAVYDRIKQTYGEML